MTEAVLIVIVVLIVLAVAGPGAYWISVAFASMRGQLTDLRADQGSLRAELADVKADLALSQERIRQLERAFREETGKEPPPHPAPPPRPASDTAGLARRVAACYSLDELDGLAFELGLADALTGETLENRAASLVMAALRRGILSELVAIARRDRPRGGF